MNQGPVPNWMLAAVAAGLQRLILLGLPFAPSAETMEGTARAWADAFWFSHRHWIESSDSQRIAVAFRIIASQVDRFPTPKQVLDAMPNRPPQRKLPMPPLSNDQIQRNRDTIQSILSKLRNKMTG